MTAYPKITRENFGELAEKHIKHYNLDLAGRISNAYYMAKMLAIEIEFIREYLIQPEYKKMLSEVKAKNNHFTKSIEGVLPKEDVERIEEDAYDLLEILYKETSKYRERDKKLGR